MTPRFLSALLLIQALFAGNIFADVAAEKNLMPVRQKNENPLKPASFDSDIVGITALLLNRQHYSQKRFDDKVSGQFLNRYLDSLDGLHLYFLQSDLDSFEEYRKTLDDLSTKRNPDASPAYRIFNVFMERMEQQYAYVTDLLKETRWDFTSDDRYVPNRKDLPRAKDLAEAKEFWRNRVRYEYLQEKLNQQPPEEVAAAVIAKLKENKKSEIHAALKDLAGKERIDQIIKMVDANTGPLDSLSQAIISKLTRENHEETIKVISKRYSRIVRSFRDVDSDDVLQIYLSALAHVYDPHTDYLGRAELDNFSINMNLSLFGIGAVLTSEDGYCKIRELMAAGPAARSGKIKPNDKILAVAQDKGEWIDVVDMKLRKVVDLIRGPKGTRVRLKVNPSDAADPSIRNEIELVRDEIKLEDQEAKAKLIEFPDSQGVIQKVGIIDLPSFYASFAVGSQKRDESENKSTTADVTRLIERLQKEKVAGIILDLRRNGGGSLEEAINLTGIFIKKGPVVQVKNADDSIEVDEDTDPRVVYDGPMVVLTSRFSASASEILAGALQDYGRAIIVGDISTHGKGTVQSVTQLSRLLRTTNNLGAVKLTIRKFYRASGDSTQRKGVTPDIVLPSVNNVLDTGESELEYALPFDTIKAADYDRLNRISPVLGDLKKHSEERVNKDKDFAYIRDEMERFLKAKQDKSVSLNEAKRRQEKKENKDRAEARKKELQARGESKYKTYDLKLKDVDLPTLPLAQKTKKDANGKEHAADGSSTEKKKSSSSLDDDEDGDEDAIPEVDFTADEAKRILLDYVKLSAGPKGVAATRE